MKAFKAFIFFSSTGIGTVSSKMQQAVINAFKEVSQISIKRFWNISAKNGLMES